MAINYEKVVSERKQIVSKTCDRCKKTCDDIMDMQEFIHIEEQGGYAATHWGDMTNWRVDLCEACSFELFHEFAEQF